VNAGRLGCKEPSIILGNLLYDGSWMNAAPSGPIHSDATQTYEFRHNKGLSSQPYVVLPTAPNYYTTPGTCNTLLCDGHVEAFDRKQLPGPTSFSSNGSFTTPAIAAKFGRPCWYIDQ
jgi:prepilin-type processing-associated H-X9-DG protein